MLKKLFVLSLMISVLPACSMFKKQHFIGDQTKTYGSATEVQPLQTSTSLPQNKIGSETETLPTNIQAKSLNDIPLPPGSLADQVATGQVPKSVLSQKLPEVK